MKSKLLLAFSMVFTINGFSQTTAIPDNNFEQYLIDRGFDDVIDGSVLTVNIENVTSLTMSEKGISDLTGIEDFNALRELLLSGNSDLTNINVSSNTNLVQLYVDNTGINTIDISNLTALEDLRVFNTDLSTLNVSSNLALSTLLADNTLISALDVSNNTSLKTLFIGSSQITSLNLSNNSQLTNLNSENTDITSLDLSNNTGLKFLTITNTNINVLNLDANINLEEFYGASILVSNIDFTKNVQLKKIFLSDTSISSLDITKNTQLVSLTISGNQLSSLDITQNILLTELIVGNNALTELDVTKNINLLTLDVSSNQIVNVDINKNTQLTTLQLQNNKLERAYLSNGTNSSITSFDIRQNSALTCVTVDEVSFANTNWINKDATASYSLDCNAIWTVYTTDVQFEDSIVNTNNVDTNNDGKITYEEAQSFTGDLNLSGKGIEEITGLEAFSSANTIDLSNNKIKDVNSFLNSDSYLVKEKSANTKKAILSRPKIRIRGFNVSNNSISEIDISGVSGIEELYASGNQLESLNLKQGLKKSGFNSDLKILDVRNNPKLTCIIVDNVVEANNKPNWQKDNTASYNTNCDKSLSTEDALLKNNVLIYPNPAKSFIEVYLKDELQLENLEIYNFVGKKVVNSKKIRVEIADLPIGIYYIKVITNKGVKSTKVIKQ